jgi:hypothetical protein
MKTPLLYGVGVTVVTAVITIVAQLLGYWTDPEKLLVGMVVGLGSAIVVITAGIVLGTQRARAEQGAGEFSYGSAYKNGVMIALFAAASGLLFNYVFFTVLVPDFTSTQAEFVRSMMEKLNAPPDKIDEAVESVRAKGTLVAQLRSGFVSTVVLGAIISLITSAFLKRKPAGEPPPMA